MKPAVKDNFRLFIFPVLIFTALVFLFLSQILGISAPSYFQSGASSTAPLFKEDPVLAVGTSSLSYCPAKIASYEVRGGSLDGVLEPGSEIKAELGIYACEKINRNDIVLYNYAGNPGAPLVKIVKGVPGDKFSLVRASAGCGYNILINGAVLKNSQSLEYCLDNRGHKTLSLYVDDYGGIIPAGDYLIMGNLPRGSLDSGRFGLVSQTDILGKVLLK